MVDTDSFQNATQGGSFSVVLQSNNMDLVFTSAVPEPSTWAPLDGGVAGLCLLALRRHHTIGA